MPEPNGFQQECVDGYLILTLQSGSTRTCTGGSRFIRIRLNQNWASFKIFSKPNLNPCCGIPPAYFWICLIRKDYFFKLSGRYLYTVYLPTLDAMWEACDWGTWEGEKFLHLTLLHNNYRWFPLYPNMANPNSAEFKVPFDLSAISTMHTCLLFPKFDSFERILLGVSFSDKAWPTCIQVATTDFKALIDFRMPDLCCLSFFNR